MIGKTISHYKILEKLGEGGMGVVYKAQDTRLDRIVALKFLPKHLLCDEEAKKRFVHEARAASALNHTNITTIYEIDEAEVECFISMEYVEGKSLKELIKNKQTRKWDMLKIMDVGIQMVEGLSKAHRKGIVHRDIKSDNIMLTNEGIVKIMDFGLAKLKGVPKVTKTGTTIGTVAYMSPEQTRGEEVDHRTDIWSFGVVLYEMLTGELPFQGEYEAAVIYQILNAEPKAIQWFRQDVPDNILTLVSQLLQKDSASRLSSTKEITQRLRERPREKATEEGKKSIAVLYFENMSSEKENEYFCAGMTEDLIIDLSKIQHLKVIPRSDILPFRSKEVNSRQVGKTLGVQYILEGTVRKGANRIRITAQLIDVKSGFQVWAERYDRLIEDIFDVQIEVSEKIAEALKLSLTESEKQSLAKKPTDDLRAYDFYMRGSEFLSRRGQKDRQTAIQMFEHALSIDPNFSLAYVALAEAYSFNYMAFGGDRSWLEKMMEMNEKALSLDPDLIEAQFGIGMVYFHQKRFAQAKRNFEKVLEGKNDYYQACHWLGLTLVVLGDYDRAIKYFKRAAALKPYSEEPWHLLEQSFRKIGKSKSAQGAANKMIELGARKLEVNPKDVAALSRLAVTYAAIGENKKALEAVRRVMEIDPDDGVGLYNCAGAYACLGMKEKALKYLEKASEAGWWKLSEWIQNDPSLESIRDDPRFQQILSKHSV
jgi:serine/threonine protein kinase/cytochrome c-type biogenesis protein CcmH/NrfG